MYPKLNPISGDDALERSVRGASGFLGVSRDKTKWMAYTTVADGTKKHIGVLRVRSTVAPRSTSGCSGLGVQWHQAVPSI